MNINSECEMYKLALSSDKRQAVYMFFAELGVNLSKESKDVLEQFVFKDSTIVQYRQNGVRIFNREKDWAEELCIGVEGTFSYYRGRYCVF